VFGLFYSRHWPLIERVGPFAALAVYVAAVMILGRRLPFADAYIRYALACVLVQSAMLALVTGGLFWGKAIALRMARRRGERTDQITALMVNYALAGEGEALLAASAQRHPSEFLKVWENSLSTLKGSARDRVLALLSRTGLADRLRAQVLASNPGRAIRAIALLRELNAPDSLEVIERALDHTAETVRASALIALAAHGSEAQQERAFTMLAKLPFWQRIVLFQHTRADSAALEKFLLTALASEDNTNVLAALEFILGRQRMLAVRDAYRLATARDVEVRIKFFKALPLLATDQDPAVLVQGGLEDRDWRVRAMAARACGVLRLSSVAPVLEERLAAAVQHAEAGHLARALAALGGEALRRLHAFTVSDNEMRRAVAAEVLEKSLLAAPGGMR
jgi:hypothetical protein